MSTLYESLRGFDSEYYLNQNSDVAAAVDAGDFESAWQHYQLFGGAELRKPNIVFDPEFYLAQNPDVAAAVDAGDFQNAFQHFTVFGLNEGRTPDSYYDDFDADDYLAQNTDVAEAVDAGIFQSAFQHYAMYGYKESRPGSIKPQPTPTPGDDTVDAEYSLTSLTLADATDDGDTTFVIDLVDTVNLTTINLSGGEATDITIDANAAQFAGAVTINIGDFGVDADGVLAGGLDYTADTTNNFREQFKFVGDNIGDITIDDFLTGIGNNADRLDFSAFAGVTGLDDLNLAFDGIDTTTITSDAFDGTIEVTTVGGVDLSTDAANFMF